MDALILQGRETEQGILERALAAAAGGAGHAVLIEGPPGAGKSTLLADACFGARRAGFEVLRARGNEMEHEFGFGVARQLFAQSATGEGSAKPLPEPLSIAMSVDLASRPEHSHAGPAVLQALFDLTADLAGRRPLVLAVDDLHWADASSIRALGYVAGRIAHLPVALLLTLRSTAPGAPDDLLDALRAEQTAQSLAVPPLGPVAVSTMVRARMASADEELCRACFVATTGNPLYLQELLRFLAPEGSDTATVPAQAVHDASIAPLGDRVARRIARVSQHAPTLAAAMAVLGEGGSLALAARLAGMSRAEAGTIAGRLRRIEVLASEDPCEFVHPLVRRSIYDTVPVPTRDALHAGAARTLEAEGGSPERIAAHHAAVTPAGSSEVASALLRAAERSLGRAAPDEAVRWLRRLVAEGAPLPPPGEVLALLGFAEVILWDPEAIDHLRQARVSSDDPALRARVSIPLAEALFLTGQWQEAVDTIVECLAEVAPGDTETRAGLSALGLLITMYSPTPAAGLDQDPETLESLMRGPGWASHALAAVWAGIGAHRGDPPDQVRSLLDTATRTDALLSVQGHETWALAHVMIALGTIDDHEGGLAYSERVLAAARDGGMVNLRAAGHAHRGWILARTGALAEAEAELRPALDLGLETRAPTVVASVCFYLQDVMLERSGLTEVASRLEQLDPDEMGLADTMMELLLRTARGRLRLAARRRAAALEDLRRALDVSVAIGSSPTVSPARSLVALALPATEGAQARALVAAELQEARRIGYSRPIGLALRAAGMLERGERALDPIAESIEHFHRAGARLEVARSRLELGAALRRSGQRARAQAELGLAMEAGRACAADLLVDRAVEELRAAGARPRRTATTGPASLTASELRVAQHAARGLTNREIAQELYVSAKTVETHLSHAYAKLRLRGRGARGQLHAALDGHASAESGTE